MTPAERAAARALMAKLNTPAALDATSIAMHGNEHSGIVTELHARFPAAACFAEAPLALQQALDALDERDGLLQRAYFCIGDMLQNDPRHTDPVGVMIELRKLLDPGYDGAYEALGLAKPRAWPKETT